MRTWSLDLSILTLQVFAAPKDGVPRRRAAERVWASAAVMGFRVRLGVGSCFESDSDYLGVSGKDLKSFFPLFNCASGFPSAF